jgi:hypothetical protein
MCTCVPGESDDGAAPGARIYCTTDGGGSWNRTFWAPQTSSMGFSLIEIRYATDTDICASSCVLV